MTEWIYVGPFKIDTQGRITIPKRWRQQLQLNSGDIIHIKIAKEKVGKASET